MTSIHNHNHTSVNSKLSIQKPYPGPNKRARIEEKIQLLQMLAIESGKPDPDKSLKKPSWTLIAQPKHPADPERNKRMVLQVHSYVDPTKEGKIFEGIELNIDEKTYYISNLVAKTTVMRKVIFPLQELLNGNRFEYLSFEQESQASDENWSNAWKDEHEVEAGKTYREILYPAITAVVSQILPQDRSSVILEVCAGDGELAAQILEKSSPNIAKYHLLDANRFSCQKAIQYLEPFSSPVTVSQQDITQDYTAQIGKEAVDLVIGCGALTKQVLANKEEALKALHHIHTCLKVGGVLLLTGATASCIHANDLEQAGFTVTNTILPADRARNFYMAVKRDL